VGKWVELLSRFSRQKETVKTDLYFYLKGYKPPDEGASEYQSIPLNKIEDFGVHCKQYVSFRPVY
jgi:hypothetical protein